MSLSLCRNVVRHSARIAVFFTLLTVSALASRAQVVFSPSQSVSTDGGSGQQMLIGSQGDIYIAWIGGFSGCSVCFSRSTDGGLTFSTPLQVSNSGGNVSMVVDPTGTIYIGWKSTSSTSGLFVTRSDDRGATFSTPVRATNISGDSPELAVDPNGNIGIVWRNIIGNTSILPCPSDCPPIELFDYGVFFSQSSDGGNTFSQPTEAFSTQGDPPGQFPSFQLAMPSSGQVYVLGQDAGFVGLARSSDGGATFSTSNITNASVRAGQTKMTLDAAGDLDVVWTAFISGIGDHVFFSRSTDMGATFSRPTDLTPSSGGDGPNIAVDSSGNIHVAWCELEQNFNPAGTIFFSRSMDGGTTFSSPIPLSTDPSLGSGINAVVPGPVSMAVGPGGKVSIVWEDDDSANRNQNPSQSTQWDVYLASSSDGGATFQGPVNVSNNSGISDWPIIAVDANSTTYVAWVQSPPSPFNFNVNFSRGIALSLTSLGLSSASVTGGSSSTGTLTLSGPAPTGGAVVSLSSSDASVSVPASVTIAEGTTSATFAVTTSPVAAATTATVTATFSGVTQTGSITVEPPVLTSLVLSSSSVSGGSSTTATVTLSGPAPAGGSVMALASSNTSVATVPSSVTVAPGFTNVTFTVSTSRELCPSAAAISASFSGVTQTSNLAVMPFVNLPSQACAAITSH